MRELFLECRRCGRRQHVPAGRWSGVTDAYTASYECVGGCPRDRRGEVRGSGLGPLCFALALVAAPLAGVLLAQG